MLQIMNDQSNTALADIKASSLSGQEFVSNIRYKSKERCGS